MGRSLVSVELGGGDAESCCGRSGVQAAAPDGNDEVRVCDGQGAGEVDRVGAAQGMASGEAASVLLHGRG
jgi:hypothetical protein